jgi:phosphate-selective porin
MPPPPPPPPVFPHWGGYGDGAFFLRDSRGWFVLFPKGRLQIDGYTYLNRGDVPMGVQPNSPADPRPRHTIFVRRARVELQGTMFKHWDFHIAGEFGSVPSTGTYGTVADAYVVADYFSFAKAQIGQFDVPFSLENRTSDKYFDFMERSLAVRAFGAPTNKDIGGMVFGWLPRNVAYYSVGVFNGDGQSFKNQDVHPAVIGRAFVAPLAWLPSAQTHLFLQDLWVGASFWWQKFGDVGAQATPNAFGGGQDDLPNMTTQGGFTFFSSSFPNGVDNAGNKVRSHLVPFGTTVKWALEVNAPVWRWAGLRFEYVHVSQELGMYNDTNPSGATVTRVGPLTGGSLDGYGMYLEAWGWVIGDNRFVERPGLETAPRLKALQQPSPRWGLMLTAKYERLAFDVSGLPLSVGMMGNVPALVQGHYLIQTFEVGVNAWATKHVRLTANYVLNHPDGDSAQMRGNYYFDRNEHELLFRVGANL